ncbi:MAG: hypothetical protein J5873_00600 [Bacteroidales bacterium]|nr:hypothetical protein [Bacteroidales bacterium]
MNVKTLSVSAVARIAGINLLLFAVAYALPALAHAFAWPLYRLEPMRMVLLVGLLMALPRGNTYFLAVTLPLFSLLVSGHPAGYKCVLMLVELVANVAFFFGLRRILRSVFLSMLAAIVLSKAVYYAAKAVVVAITFPGTAVFGTGLLPQLLWTAVIAALFAGLSAVRAAADK